MPLQDITEVMPNVPKSWDQYIATWGPGVLLIVLLFIIFVFWMFTDYLPNRKARSKIATDKEERLAELDVQREKAQVDLISSMAKVAEEVPPIRKDIHQQNRAFNLIIDRTEAIEGKVDSFDKKLCDHIDECRARDKKKQDSVRPPGV